MKRLAAVGLAALGLAGAVSGAAVAGNNVAMICVPNDSFCPEYNPTIRKVCIDGRWETEECVDNLCHEGQCVTEIPVFHEPLTDTDTGTDINVADTAAHCDEKRCPGWCNRGICYVAPKLGPLMADDTDGVVDADTSAPECSEDRCPGFCWRGYCWLPPKLGSLQADATGTDTDIDTDTAKRSACGPQNCSGKCLAGLCVPETWKPRPDPKDFDQCPADCEGICIGGRCWLQKPLTVTPISTSTPTNRTREGDEPRVTVLPYPPRVSTPVEEDESARVTVLPFPPRVSSPAASSSSPPSAPDSPADTETENRDAESVKRCKQPCKLYSKVCDPRSGKCIKPVWPVGPNIDNAEPHVLSSGCKKLCRPLKEKCVHDGELESCVRVDSKVLDEESRPDKSEKPSTTASSPPAAAQPASAQGTRPCYDPRDPPKWARDDAKEGAWPPLCGPDGQPPRAEENAPSPVKEQEKREPDAVQPASAQGTRYCINPSNASKPPRGARGVADDNAWPPVCGPNGLPPRSEAERRSAGVADSHAPREITARDTDIEIPSLAEIGAICPIPGEYACSSQGDRSFVSWCTHDGQWERKEECIAPSRCRLSIVNRSWAECSTDDILTTRDHTNELETASPEKIVDVRSTGRSTSALRSHTEVRVSTSPSQNDIATPEENTNRPAHVARDSEDCSTPNQHACRPDLDTFGWAVYVCSPEKKWRVLDVCGGNSGCCHTDSKKKTAYCICPKVYLGTPDGTRLAGRMASTMVTSVVPASSGA